MAAPPSVSVVIRAKNEAAGIRRTIELVQQQEGIGSEPEIIVVDSGSTDGTVDIVRKAEVPVITIPAGSFTFGGSLNRGCQEAHGEVIVALSAHAYPPDERWLARMLESFADPRVACASGEDRGPDRVLLDGRVSQDMELARRYPQWGYSNAAGAFRAELWQQKPFRADMPGTEDKEWAWHWLQRDSLVVIGSDLQVDHDHSKDPIHDLFERARREWVGFGMYLDLEPYSARQVLRDWWSERDGYRSTARARLSHRRASRLAGRWAGQRASRAARRDQLRLAVMADEFPALSETFVTTEIGELRRAGHDVRVEAIDRAVDSAASVPEDLPVRYMTDESLPAKLRDVTWLAARHPGGCIRDLRSRRRWKTEERVRPLRALAGRARRATRESVTQLHVHFANESALEAMRIGRITGVPYSVTAHAYDIFLSPMNLAEKLDSAAFVTTGCEYNARHLRRLVKDPASVHTIVMGVDGERFRRTEPHPSGRIVLAVGRLVEKKGFDVLLEAAALLRQRDRLDELVIAGDGPLRNELEALSEACGLEEVTTFAGAQTPGEIRAALERAAVLAMPCVIARDGDRDSMPVVCKEALAMEVPVVASDEVGLPELITPGWGRLVAPRDPEALAEALAELLSLPVDERAAMGRSGREWVLEHCDAARETAKLVELVRTRVILEL